MALAAGIVLAQVWSPKVRRGRLWSHRLCQRRREQVRGHRPVGHHRPPGHDIIAREGGNMVNVSQGGRDYVFGNKCDDTLDVQDGEATTS